MRERILRQANTGTEQDPRHRRPAHQRKIHRHQQRQFQVGEPFEETRNVNLEQNRRQRNADDGRDMVFRNALLQERGFAEVQAKIGSQVTHGRFAPGFLAAGAGGGGAGLGAGGEAELGAPGEAGFWAPGGKGTTSAGRGFKLMLKFGAPPALWPYICFSACPILRYWSTRRSASV